MGMKVKLGKGPIEKTAGRGKLLIGNGTVITLGEENRVIPAGAVLIRGKAIESVGDTRELKRANPSARFLDARGMVIMPGFINTHHHLYSTFARGLSPKQPPPYTFVEILERLWWPLDRALKKEDLYWSALVPLIACVKSGTTAIIDHHESQSYQLGSLDRIERAVLDAGIRACLCLGLSDRYGKGEEGIRENVRFIRKKKIRPDLVKGIFGLHAGFTVGEATLENAVAAADALDVGFHVHVAEARSDQEDSLKKYGKTIIQRFLQRGVLGPKSLMIHCVHVSPRDMDILSETGTPVVHNPQSNMNNAVGVAHVLEMMEKGVLVGLGTDGMTSNMGNEVRVANILHKLAKGDPRVAFVESCELLLKNNAVIAGFFFDRPLGVLEPGAYADVILLRYDPPTPLNGDTFLGHFLFGLTEAPVDTTIVGGKVLMEGGKLRGINERAVNAETRKLAARFWKRF